MAFQLPAAPLKINVPWDEGLGLRRDGSLCRSLCGSTVDSLPGPSRRTSARAPRVSEFDLQVRTLQQPAGVGPSLLAVILFEKGLMSFQDGGDSIEQTINLLNLQYLVYFKDATYLHLFLNAAWPFHWVKGRSIAVAIPMRPVLASR